MAFATKCRTNVVEILQSCTLQGVQYAQSHKSSFQFFDNPYWTLYNILHDSRQKYLPLHSCKNLLLNSTPSIICKMRQIVWKQLDPYQNENRAFLLPTRSNIYLKLPPKYQINAKVAVLIIAQQPAIVKKSLYEVIGYSRESRRWTGPFFAFGVFLPTDSSWWGIRIEQNFFFVNFYYQFFLFIPFLIVTGWC